MKVLFALLGLLLGSWLGYSTEISDIIGFILISILFFVLAIRTRRAWPFCLGFALGYLALRISLPVAEGEQTLSGIVTRTGSSYFLLKTPSEALYVYCEDCPYQIGDFLRVTGSPSALKMTTYESRFNFADYLRAWGVKRQIQSPEIAGAFLWPVRFAAMRASFLSGLNENASSLLSSLLFGVTDSSSAAGSLVSSLGLYSAFSSSGVLLSFFYRQAQKHLGYLMANQAKAKRVSLLFLLPFLPWAFRKIGVARVLLVAVLENGNSRFFKNRWSRCEIVGFSAILLWIICPYAALQSGYLVGYGISLTSLLSRSFQGEAGPSREAKRENFLRVQLLLLPMWLQNGSFHLFGAAFYAICLPLGVLYATLGLFGYLGLPMAWALNPLGNGLAWLLGVFSKMDVSLALPSFGVPFLLLYLLALAYGEKAGEYGFAAAKKGARLALLGAYCLSLLPIVPALSQSVSFINVGQGDSILIQDGGEAVMIDTGGNLHFDMAEEVLIPYLRSRRIYDIDVLIASHSDYDHIGAKDSLMEHFTVKRFVEDASDFPLDVGSLHFENYNVYGGEEENETSLVLSLSFMGKSWLFTGDATTGIEAQILADHPDIDCDILKVGHHGSDTSTSEAFLDALTPEVAVISVGAANSYGHPKQVVLDRLAARGIEIRRTDLEGTIVYSRPKS